MKEWLRSAVGDANLSAPETIIVPLNHPGAGSDQEGGHWTLVVVRVKEGLIQAFDSLSPGVFREGEHPHTDILHRIGVWVQHLNKKRLLKWPTS